MRLRALTKHQQGKLKCRSEDGPIEQPNLAAVRFHDGLGEGQPKARNLERSSHPDRAFPKIRPRSSEETPIPESVTRVTM